MITERTLKKWRREALVYTAVPMNRSAIDMSMENNELRKRIIKLTQELSDLMLTTYTKKG
jgi:hypothetical protein